ncbi:MAG: ribulose-phosphate 3-epimerase [Clostridia bacterium]|nr:ribulose-phosphate 3-epimerase [Clostridia bacterium]
MNKQKKIAPSMMCCDIFNLKKQIEIFEETKIELLHIDIMDGHLVPNITLGTDYVKSLKASASIPLDIHLMVENPESLIPLLTFGEGDYVSIHAESTRHITKCLQMIKEKGACALLALNPGTPLSAADEVIPYIDGLLIMTVNPGFAGQKMVDGSLDKITRARNYLDSHGLADAEIEVDGNVSFENGRRMSAAGADIFVAGTSSVFHKEYALKDAIAKFRECIK